MTSSIPGSSILGWISSAILVLTIGTQVHKQWKTESSEGISKWLFLGQCAAEVGFIAYSWALRNWVFLFTNAVLLAECLLGYAILRHHRRRRARRAGAPKGPGYRDERSDSASAASIAAAANGTRPSSA